MPRSLAMVVDRDGTIRKAEGSALEALGVPGEQALGRDALEVFRDWPPAVRCVRSALGGCPERTQLELRGIPIVLEAEPRLHDGHRDGALLVALEAVLPLFLRQLPGVVWATDRDLRITWALGRIPAEFAQTIVGTTIGEFVGTHDPDDPGIAHHRAALGGEPQTFSYPFRDRWFYVKIEPLRDDAGAPCGCVGTAVDVTERRRAMQQLESTVSLLNATLEATADGLLVVDSAGHVVAFNERFGRMWRLPEDALARRNDAELLDLAREQLGHPEDFLRGVQQLYEDPERESFDCLQFKDGRVFERYSRPQHVGQRVVGRVWSFRDVTERERNLGRTIFLGEATRLLASLDIEKALDALVLLAVPCLGENCVVELFEGATTRKLFARARDKSKPIRGTAPRAVTEGHPMLFADEGHSKMAVPLLVKGTAVGAITFTAPVARRYDREDLEFAQQLAERAALSVENARLYRDAQEALGARDEFLSVVAHEIRGPLTSIHLCAQTLRQRAGQSTETTRAVEIIEREDRRLGSFVDELLDVGHIRGGRFHFAFERVDLSEAVRGVAERLSDEVARARTTLSVDTDGPVLGEWDRFRIEQVVANLVSNAVKFSLGKPVEITVRAADGFAVLQVRDHGAGIPSEVRERIFLPFERAVSTRHFGGLGLGLYIARTIVGGLGGSIDVESKPDEGSTFTVRLPRQRAP